MSQQRRVSLARPSVTCSVCWPVRVRAAFGLRRRQPSKAAVSAARSTSRGTLRSMPSTSLLPRSLSLRSTRWQARPELVCPVVRFEDWPTPRPDTQPRVRLRTSHAASHLGTGGKQWKRARRLERRLAGGKVWPRPGGHALSRRLAGSKTALRAPKRRLGICCEMTESRKLTRWHRRERATYSGVAKVH